MLVQQEFDKKYTHEYGFNGPQLAKKEKSIPHMSLPWNL